VLYGDNWAPNGALPVEKVSFEKLSHRQRYSPRYKALSPRYISVCVKDRPGRFVITVLAQLRAQMSPYNSPDESFVLRAKHTLGHFRKKRVFHHQNEGFSQSVLWWKSSQIRGVSAIETRSEIGCTQTEIIFFGNRKNGEVPRHHSNFRLRRFRKHTFFRNSKRKVPTPPHFLLLIRYLLSVLTHLSHTPRYLVPSISRCVWKQSSWFLCDRYRKAQWIKPTIQRFPWILRFVLHTKKKIFPFKRPWLITGQRWSTPFKPSCWHGSLKGKKWTRFLKGKKSDSAKVLYGEDWAPNGALPVEKVSFGKLSHRPRYTEFFSEVNISVCV